VNWLIFAIVGFIALVLDLSLAQALRVGDVAPSFAVLPVVFVAMFGPRRASVWAGWLMGFCVDANTMMMHGSDTVAPLLGPHALGFAFGAVLVLQLRTVLYRQRALTFAVMTMLCVIAISLMVVFLYAVHGWYPGEELYWSQLRPSHELFRRLGVALYTAIAAFITAPLFLWTQHAWGFRSAQHHAHHHRTRR
jgi:rod shape-determining protein MreD